MTEMAGVAAEDGVRQAESIAPVLASKSTALWAGGAGFLASFVCLAVFWYRHVRLFYFPSGDEFSLFVHSAKPFHPAISEWFLHGFSGYFMPYPQWSASQTDFLRPVANAEYYLGSLIFGLHWSGYLLSNYVIQSAVVGAAIYLAVRHLKLRAFSLVLLGLICFLSPAFDGGALFSTAFPFDLLAAVFVFAGISLLFSGRLVLAWLCFTIGIFTKETALFAPLAASMTVYWTSSRRDWRRWVAPVLFLIPYVCWEGLRRASFHGTAGIYAIGSGGIHALSHLQNLLAWPVPFASPLGKRFAFGVFPLSLSVDLFVILNLCFWIGIAVLLFRFSRIWIRSGDRSPEGAAVLLLRRIGFSSSTQQALCLFCAGSSAILLLIPHLEPRFGATFLPLFAMVLAIAFERSPRPLLRAAALCFLVVPLAVNAVERARQAPGNVRSAHLQWAMAADYIHEIAHSSSPMIFSVDDLSGGYSSTGSIQKFAGYSGHLVRVDDLLQETNCPAQPRIKISRISDAAVSIVSMIDPTCGGHTFFGADITPIGGRGLTRQIGPVRMIYQGMPQLPRHSLAVPGRLSVTIEHSPANAVVLLPEMTLRGYREEPLYHPLEER